MRTIPGRSPPWSLPINRRTFCPRSRSASRSSASFRALSAARPSRNGSLSIFPDTPFLAQHSEALGLALVVIPITYLSIVVGELVPKRLALNNPEKIARLVAVPMRWLSRAAHPLVVLLSYSTNALLRMLGVKPSTEPSVTEEEIKLMIDQGTQAGTFHASEQDMIERVFRLADRKVAVLMTPRTNVVWLDLDDSEAETRQKIAQHAYSFFPVGQGALDNIVGSSGARTCFPGPWKANRSI